MTEKIYEYENVKIAVIDDGSCLNDYSGLKKGQMLFVENDLENEFDENAIMITTTELDKLGYIYRGWFQDMLNDFLRREDDIFCLFNHADEEGVYLDFKLYRNG